MHGDTVSGYKIRLIGLVVAVIIVNDKSPLEQQQRRLRNSLHLAVRRTAEYTPTGSSVLTLLERMSQSEVPYLPIHEPIQILDLSFQSQQSVT